MARPAHLMLIMNRLDKCHMSQNECARRCGVSKLTIHKIVTGRSTITPRMALAFQDVLHLDAEQLLRGQISYQLQKARKGLDDELFAYLESE